MVNSDYQSRIPKMEYYKFCKQGWIWSAQSSIQQIHVDALYNAKQLSQESNTLGGLSFSPVKCSWNVKWLTETRLRSALILSSPNSDYKLDYDTIKVHFTPFYLSYWCINWHPHSENLQKLARNRVSNPMKNFTYLKCSYLWCVCLLLLIISAFNGNIESIAMEMALTEIFCLYYMNKMCKDAFLLIGNFHY